MCKLLMSVLVCAFIAMPVFADELAIEPSWVTSPAMAVVTPPTTRTGWGSFEYSVRFTVPKTSGYIVQHITTYCSRYKCDGTTAVLPEVPPEYWEAWKVEEGDVKDGYGRLVDTDTFLTPADSSERKGYHFIDGRVRFLENYKLVLANDGGVWGVPGSVEEAGALWATYQSPPDWTDEGLDPYERDAAAPHWMTVNYASCTTGHVTVNQAKSFPHVQIVSSPPSSVNASSGESLAKVLHDLPSWVSMQELGKEQRESASREYFRISKRPLSEIRQGVAAYVREFGSNIEALSKVFLLNRFVFKVPSSVGRMKNVYFGSWRGVPFTKDTVDPLWPLSLDSGGNLRIVGVFGGYYGPKYMALDEFEYFAATYGPRVSR